MAKPSGARRATSIAVAATAAAPEPDIVDMIFDYLHAESLLAAGSAEQVREAKLAVREYFRGEQVYIAARPASARQELALQVLSLFNGRNATELARTFGIGRSTVYRILKQDGRRDSAKVAAAQVAQALRAGE